MLWVLQSQGNTNTFKIKGLSRSNQHHALLFNGESRSATL